MLPARGLARGAHCVETPHPAAFRGHRSEACPLPTLSRFLPAMDRALGTGSHTSPARQETNSWEQATEPRGEPGLFGGAPRIHPKVNP